MTCEAVTVEGRRCRRVPMLGSMYCAVHDPKRARREARRAAELKRLRTLAYEKGVRAGERRCCAEIAKLRAVLRTILKGSYDPAAIKWALEGLELTESSSRQISA